MRKQLVLCTLLACLIGPVLAQKAVLVLQTPDSMKASLEVDQKVINTIPASQIQAPSLRAGRHSITLRFANEQYSPFSTTLHLSAGKQTTYRVKPKKAVDGSINFGLALVSEVQAQNSSTPADDEEEVETTADTTQVVFNDTALVAPRSGCGSPPSLGQLEIFLRAQEARYFQEEKLSAAKRFALDHCLKVNQLEQIIDGLDFEDHRLELALFVRQKVYDPSSLSRLEKAFFLSSSQKRWKEALSQR